MQYVWQHRLWPRTLLRTVDGRPVQIIDPGRLNTDAGPDFFNAKIAIAGHTWAGDVEIHVRASDWHRHGHDGDPAYDSVILHVVDRDDAPIVRSNGETIPQMQMACSPDFYQRYSQLVDRADRDLPCCEAIASMSTLHMTSWLDALAFERLYEKTDTIEARLTRLGRDWDATAYVTLARCLGFGVNGDPFERLATATPLQFLAKHCDSLFTIEALLLGQSGLLENVAVPDSYCLRLKKEYDFMAHKFGLRRPESPGWKMSRMRPANFPHRRIAMLAALLNRNTRLMSMILDITSIEQATEIFALPFTGYWADHFTFGAPSAGAGCTLSRSSVVGLIINAVVPLQYAWGTMRDDRAMTDRAIDLLQSLPAERNTIVQMFQQAGIPARSAFATQALIQLRRAYCEPHKCLYCRIGHRTLSARCPRT